MPPVARSAFDFFSELCLAGLDTEPPLHREAMESDLVDLVDEAFVQAVLADEVPPEARESLEVFVAPVWDEEPVAGEIEVSMTWPGRQDPPVRRSFRSGRWTRRAQARAWELAADGSLGEGARTSVRIVAEGPRRRDSLPLRGFHAPVIATRTLEDLGVREVGGEPLCARRPVLVNRRMLEDIVSETEAAGATETGGGVLGTIVRLDEPIAGAATRVVTVLTTAVSDPRHTGEVARVTFDPGALAYAAHIAGLRGSGERVLTAYHSHGWGSGCGRCNRSAECAIPSASYVSLDDYRVLESLFPSKSTVLPIAGRKLGAPGDRPVLEIHAWMGGRMEPISWRTYDD
jgi:hypothetical protein